ncbi:MAG: hypothetical protein A4S09_07090 [Proteobacteria bacterium SG_bin7]|nr:MAG: hypothetical protein A4S09_07090 [Proteobacteria bacterium SG_bin7]
MKIFYGLLLFPLLSHAAVDIAFLEMRNYKGEIIRLEPSGVFAHIAISYNGAWLHSHPHRGVEIISTENLETMGKVKEIVHLTEFPEITEAQVQTFLNKPYDPEFSWDGSRIYCAELIGKLLGIPPQSMTFKADYWRGRLQHLLVGGLGLSPDDIYKHLKNKRAKFCSTVF